MNEALAVALAIQLTLAAIAKRTAAPGEPKTLLSVRFPRVRPWAFSGADLLLATLVLAPPSRGLGSILVLIMIGTSIILQVTTEESGLDCGCFGTPRSGDSRSRALWATLLLAAEALWVAAGPTFLSASPLPISVGLTPVLVAGFVWLQPQVLLGLRRRRSISGQDALRELATDPGFETWRDRLLNRTPRTVTFDGREHRMTFDALHNERVIILTAWVRAGRVRLHAVDGETLMPVGSVAAHRP